MKLHKGDKVELIFTGDIGTIQSFYDHETVMVQIGQDAIPVFVAHVKKVSTKKAMPIKLPKKLATNLKSNHRIPQPDQKPDQGISLIMQPFLDADGLIDYFLLHFINDTGHALHFHYTLWLNDIASFDLKKEISGRANIILNTLAYDQMNDYPILDFDIKLLTSVADKQQQFKKSLKPKAKILRRPPQSIPQINGEGYLLKIVNKLPKAPDKKDVRYLDAAEAKALKEKLLEQQIKKIAQDNTQETKVVINAAERIIDLHIEKLVSKHKHLRKSDLLQIQINHFQKNIQEAIKRKEPKMIVIHGLGKGKLRQEIIKYLRFYPEVQTFRNDYDHRFGFGATEILFEYE